MTGDAATQPAIPIACNLGERGRAAREREFAGDLAPGIREVVGLADGYALRFPGEGDWADRLLAFVAAERRCCPFFRFELDLAPGHGPVWLRVRGDGGAKAFAAGLLGIDPDRESRSSP